MSRLQNFFLFAILFLMAKAATADTVLVAVAANFSATAKTIQKAFEDQSGHQVKLSVGSTGKLFAQIVNGAPFQVFLSADAERPRALFKKDMTLGMPRVYAYGKLALCSLRLNVSAGLSVLKSDMLQHIALANPKLAPYGKASKEVLSKLALESALEGKLVWGESVSQVNQFIVSGNADLGFISQAQMKQQDESLSCWPIADTYHEPIEQQAVKLKRNATEVSNAFFDFLFSQSVRDVIVQSGYGYADQNVGEI